MHKQEVEQDYLIKTEETLQAVFDRRNGAVDVGNGLESVCVCVCVVCIPDSRRGVLGAGRVEKRSSGECWVQGVCRGQREERGALKTTGLTV